ncbi:MAG: hypothetical protein U1F48_15865 [Burkholderiales bacterium]
MKLIIVAAIAAAAVGVAGTASAQEAAAKSAGCLNCHAVDTKKVGPSFKDVAAKYKGKADAQKMLVDKLASGKGHPEVKAKGAELDGIVKWVLAQ